MGRHKVDGLRGRHLRGDDEIALILTILIIDEDKHFAIARILNNVRNIGLDQIKGIHGGYISQG